MTRGTLVDPEQADALGIACGRRPRRTDESTSYSTRLSNRSLVPIAVQRLATAKRKLARDMRESGAANRHALPANPTGSGLRHDGVRR